MKQVLLLLAIFISSLGQSQIVDRSKQKAKDKTNQRVDTRVDQGIDKGLNAIEGLFKKKPKNDSKETTNTQETTTSDQGIQDGSKEVKDSYSFDHQVDMELISINKKGKQEDPIAYTILLSDSEPHMGTIMSIEEIKTESIIDLEQNLIISLIDQPGMKMGSAIKFDPEKFDGEAADSQLMPQATGNTRKILGYTCFEYTMEDEDGSYVYWITEDAHLNWAKAVASSSKNPMLSRGNMFTGMMMEMTYTGEKGEKTIMKVIDVRENSSRDIVTTGYRFMNFGLGR